MNLWDCSRNWIYRCNKKRSWKKRYKSQVNNGTRWSVNIRNNRTVVSSNR